MCPWGRRGEWEPRLIWAVGLQGRLVRGGYGQRKYHLMVARCAAVMGSACAGSYLQEREPLKPPTRMCLHSAPARGE